MRRINYDLRTRAHVHEYILIHSIILHFTSIIHTHNNIFINKTTKSYTVLANSDKNPNISFLIVPLRILITTVQPKKKVH